MKTGLSIITAAVLAIVSNNQAYANNDIDISIKLLAQSVASIRAISASCDIEVDPSLRSRVLETAARIPGIYMSDVIAIFVSEQTFQDRIQNTLGCDVDSNKHLEVERRNYARTLEGLRKRITDRYEQ